MGIAERLLIGKVLLAELNSEVSNLKPHNKDLPKYIKRAQMVKLQMHLYHAKQGINSPELLEQIRQLDVIIKKMEELQNKHVT